MLLANRLPELHLSLVISFSYSKKGVGKRTRCMCASEVLCDAHNSQYFTSSKSEEHG